MATQPFPVNRFGGLNLVQDPTEVGAEGAVAMSNADLDRLGRVRGRYGYITRGISRATNIGPMAFFKELGGAEHIVAVTNTGVTTSQLEAGTGTSLSTVATVPTSNNGFVRFGSPAATQLFMGDQSATIQILTGTAWTSAAIGFAAEHLAVTPNSNRLVVAAGSTVAFSDAGAPTTFGVNNYVQLHPGDGESITALVAWRDYVIAFKRSKFFVFTNESTSATGNPVFNYRAVVAGHGCVKSGAAVAGEEGVYFADRTGVYVTTGDTPRYVSRPLEPWLQAGTFTGLPSISLGMALSGSMTVLVYYERRLYVTDTFNGTTLVYDPVLDAWMVWSLTATGMCAIPKAGTLTSASPGLYFGESATSKLSVMSFDSEVTDRGDTPTNGTAVSWSWSSGAYDLSGANRVSITLESSVSGTGTVTLKVANDLGSFDTGSALTLGTSPAFLQAWQQIDREGTYWQHQLSGTGQSVVNKLVHYVSFVKPPGVQ